MDERQRRVSDIRRAALDFDASERLAFVEAACEGDDDLRREVESSLSQFEEADHSPETAAASGREGGLGGRLAGRTLGVYELGPLLGAGGMGEVYAAFDPRLKRDVAIKVVPSALAEDPMRLERLEREARATAALNHPNILAVYDIGTHDGVPFVVMERVPGETLAQRLKRGRAPVTWSIGVGVQIADALAAVHGKGILHRDLKPGNVMLTPEGRVKVLDFGLAKVSAISDTATTGLSFSTGTGQIFGTPAYMAPEQFGGAVDHRADIYSLGVILFELVTGRRPFQGHDFTAVVLNRLSDAAPSASDIEPSVPPGLSALIARCLSRDRADRPASAAAIKTELEQIRAALGDAEPEAPRPLTIWMRRAVRRVRASAASRVAAWTAAATMVAVISLAGVLDWRAPARPLVSDHPTIAVMPFENLSGQDSNDYLGIGIADALTSSLSKVSSVSVVARDAVSDSARNTSDRAALARDLGVNLLVQGSLQVAGDRVRADAKLVKPDGKVLWAGVSEALVTDLFAIERQLAERLVAGLRLSLSAAERQQIALPRTRSQPALDAYWRGVASLERTDMAGIEQATVSFQRALALDPGFAVAHAGLATAFVRKYNATNESSWMTRAAESAARALEIDPSQSEVRLTLANVYRSTGRNGSAVEELRRVLQDDPTSDEARRRLAFIFQSEGRQAEALEQYLGAVDQRPAYWVNHDQLGQFYYRTGRFADAVESFTRVAELRPDSAWAFQRLGIAFMALGDTSRATDTLEHAIAISPDAASYSNLGTIYYAGGRFEEAADAYREAIRLRPNRAIYHRNLGDAYRHLGRSEDARHEYLEAVRRMEEALRVNPNDARAMALLAVYEMKVGRRDDAERHINRALAINPSDSEVLYRRAAVFALSGNDSAALKAVSEAVAKGFSVDFVRDDDDFAPLQSMPAFQSLISPRR